MGYSGAQCAYSTLDSVLENIFKKNTLKTRIAKLKDFCLLPDCQNGPKLQIPFINLAVDLSLGYLSWSITDTTN